MVIPVETALKLAAIVAELGAEAVQTWAEENQKTDISDADINALADRCKDPESYFVDIPQVYTPVEGPK